MFVVEYKSTLQFGNPKRQKMTKPSCCLAAVAVSTQQWLEFPYLYHSLQRQSLAISFARATLKKSVLARRAESPAKCAEINVACFVAAGNAKNAFYDQKRCHLRLEWVILYISTEHCYRGGLTKIALADFLPPSLFPLQQ